MYKNYTLRLSAVLGVELPDTVSPDILTYPNFSEMRQDIPMLTINVREFARLSHCPAIQLIGERNTALGKVQTPSVRFVYEFKLLQALKVCADNQPEEKKPPIQAWIKLKQSQLGGVWANMMQLSPEIRRQLSHNAGYINADNLHVGDVAQALAILANAQSAKHVTSEVIETAMRVLTVYPVIAHQQRSQLFLTANLKQLTDTLSELTIDLPCESARHKPNVSYLANVFRQQFIAHIQPIGANLNQNHYALSEILEKLAHHPELSPAFKQKIQRFFSTFDAYKHEMQRHIAFWQTQLKACDIPTQYLTQ
ncbi:DUF3080 domain-containing protein [Aestuariibacter sp. AA17]|uniref:DUF3080 domain-containing protein n=1 Tax=Fluctibacter corallii TaxID=2984329 RepID=A0ABT3A942_9ALTE|nr:DUF3080 domain-containing protein [Aestuariibacter sp. AA17]MCV2885169.1 DUF3080 domain-containing protein [Aestuariibacter sp. AA17]